MQRHLLIFLLLLPAMAAAHTYVDSVLLTPNWTEI